MSVLGRREVLALGVPTALGAAGEAEGEFREPRTLVVADTGDFPNSRLPVLVYAGALPVGADLADRFEALFARHGWTGAWRNGLYRTHHYHSTAHEALGVFRGKVSVRLGGPGGEVLELRAGDALVIPAGVAHKNEAQSADFSVLGAYPTGTGPDMQYGRRDERPESDRRIAALRVPSTIRSRALEACRGFGEGQAERSSGEDRVLRPHLRSFADANDFTHCSKRSSQVWRSSRRGEAILPDASKRSSVA